MEQLQVNPRAMRRYGDPEVRHASSKPFILWPLYFPKVFKDNGGFDICIGNPPYVQLQKTINEETGEKLGDRYANLGFKTFIKTGDLYCLFYEKGHGLLRENGTLSFITSNKWMRANYGQKLRAFFANNTNPIRLIDFGSTKVFDSATVDVNILFFDKEENSGATKTCTVLDPLVSNLGVYFEDNHSDTIFNTDDSWVILSPLASRVQTKMKEMGTPISKWNVSINRGVLTGCNDAFIISTEKKDELIKADPKSAEIIYPLLRGRDIKRYSVNYSNLWIINTHNGIKGEKIARIDVNDYPAIKNHLDQYIETLAKRADKGDTPYNLRNCAYINDFKRSKIVWGNLCLSSQFALADEGYFINAPAPMIVPGNKYLLAVLNSKLGDWFIRQLGVTRNGGYFEYKPMFVEQLPVPLISAEQQQVFENLIDDIYALKDRNESTQAIESEIDRLVYQLYGLTEAEINYIESL